MSSALQITATHSCCSFEAPVVVKFPIIKERRQHDTLTAFSIGGFVQKLMEVMSGPVRVEVIIGKGILLEHFKSIRKGAANYVTRIHEGMDRVCRTLFQHTSRAKSIDFIKKNLTITVGFHEDFDKIKIDKNVILRLLDNLEYDDIHAWFGLRSLKHSMVCYVKELMDCVTFT